MRGAPDDGHVQSVFLSAPYTVKNIYKIEMLDDGGYSQDSYSQDNYSRDGEWNARGVYSRGHGGNSYGHNSYDRGRYSRDDNMQRMSDQLREMMNDNSLSSSQRDAVRRAVDMIGR
ncbi:MAG: hypothetical protein MJZ81_07735 [Bacteroidales bacterium]|nr:hypothetical protein [Bacteroidales bacterium]